MAIKDAEKFIDQGFSQLDKGEYKKAMRTFGKAIKADPKNPAGYYGKAEASLGDNSLSLMDVSKLYRTVIELDGENEVYMTSYADFCLSNGLLEKGAELYEQVARLTPENTSTVYIDLGYYYTVYGLLFLTRQFGKTKKDIYKDAWGYIKKGFDLSDEEGEGELNDLAGMEEGDERDVRFPWEVQLEKEELARMEATKDFFKVFKTHNNSSDPMTLLELGQDCFYSGLPLHGEKCYLRAIEADEEMGRDIFNDLSSLMHTAGKNLLADEIIIPEIEKGLSKKAIYYSIRSLGMGAGTLREAVGK